MYRIVPTKQFERSYKKLRRSGQFNTSAKQTLEEAITCLAGDEKLPSSFRDHQLNGELKPYRECHIKGDVVLVYQKQDDRLVLVLVNIGSHSAIFG